MRVLITGSREFAARSVINRALNVINEQPGPHTLIHGAAKGADRLAAAYAVRLGWTIESHPADWTKPCTPQCTHRRRRQAADEGLGFCPSAGARRNERMVQSGADICLAFYAVGAKNVGTSDCVKRAGKARITIQRFTDQPVPEQGALL